MENIEKLLISRQQNLIQPLERDVVCHFLTPLEREKLNKCSMQELLKVSLILFSSICRELGSSDKLYLAFSAAIDDLKELKMDKDNVKIIFDSFIKFAEKSRQSNFLVQTGFLP